MKLPPLIQRDFRQGRYTPYSVSTALAPQNSVADSKNINFDTIVGSAVVRSGTTALGVPVASGSVPNGLVEFVTSGSFPSVAPINALVGIFKEPGISNTTSFYLFNGFSWQPTNISGFNRVGNFIWRGATLGNIAYLTSAYNMYTSPDGFTWTVSSPTGTIPTANVGNLLHRFAGRLLTGGNTTTPDRVFFSSIINTSVSQYISWNTDPTTGDWIDINPDDGGKVTGFAEAGGVLLIFKSNGIYTLDIVTKATQPTNLFNTGAASQEAIVECQGIAYFFSGTDIRQTDGSTAQPAQISRFGVQDLIDAIPQSYWSSVAGGTDGFNVYFSIGTVTINKNKNNEKTITNCVLKFSPRDQTWSVHSYSDSFRFFSQYTTTTEGRMMRAASIDGDVHTINEGTTDNGIAINYELESQDLEFGNRSHLKQIADKLVVYTQNGMDSTVQFRQDGENTKDVPMQTSARVNIGKNINLKGNFFNFRWVGESSGTPPVLEGYEVQDITDLGTNTV